MRKIICARCRRLMTKYAKGLCMSCYQIMKRPNYTGRMLVNDGMKVKNVKK